MFLLWISKVEILLCVYDGCKIYKNVYHSVNFFHKFTKSSAKDPSFCCKVFSADREKEIMSEVHGTEI